MLEIGPEDVKILVRFLRVFSDYPQRKMAEAAGMHPSTLCRYEDGIRLPDRAELENLAKVASVPMWMIDGVLMPTFSLARRIARSSDSPLAAGYAQAVAACLKETDSLATRAALAEFLAPSDVCAEDDKAIQPNTGAGDVAGRVSDPRTTVAIDTEVNWYLEFESLTERLCAESVPAAADDPVRALDLANRARRLAEMAPGQNAWQLRLQGFSWGFVGNAQRVGSDLPAAGASFSTARTLWQAGASPPGSRLGEWRLLDLEASLYGARRQFGGALDRIDRALALAPAEVQGALHLNRGFVLEQAGRYETALAALGEAAKHAEVAREPRLRFGARFNIMVTLGHLGRYREAARRLPALRRLAAELGNEVDILRVRWLEGRIAAGLLQHEEARAALEEVQRAFVKRQVAYDSALVSLELAILHLEDGRTKEVRALAEQMLWILTGEGVHREALAALSLFRQAAESETLTVQWARQIRDYLERARSDTRLRFEETA